MPVPTYDQFIEPLLRYLAAHPDGVRARDAHDAAADALNLSPADRTEMLTSGMQPVYKNRTGWAHDRLKRAGYSACPKRGIWQLTETGFAFEHGHPQPLAADEASELATGHMDVRLRPESDTSATETAPTSPANTQSPDGRLEQALQEMRSSVAAEILELLAQVSPSYFESIVLDLLHRMGYGTSRADLQRVGGSGDGGIDGVISLDRLGLEKVYVQTKRWQGSVGRPIVQGFIGACAAGALAGQRATKGVFITTSWFTDHAIEFSGSGRARCPGGWREAGRHYDRL